MHPGYLPGAYRQTFERFGLSQVSRHGWLSQSVYTWFGPHVGGGFVVGAGVVVGATYYNENEIMIFLI